MVVKVKFGPWDDPENDFSEATFKEILEVALSGGLTLRAIHNACEYAAENPEFRHLLMLVSGQEILWGGSERLYDWLELSHEERIPAILRDAEGVDNILDAQEFVDDLVILCIREGLIDN